jgi:hypothetical protein
MGDPFFDLGNFSINHELPPTRTSPAGAYDGRRPPDRLARLTLMRIVSDFREAMWGVLQQGISTLDVDFVAYAGEHFERLLAGSTTPGFERALREAAGGLNPRTSDRLPADGRRGASRRERHDRRRRPTRSRFAATSGRGGLAGPDRRARRDRVLRHADRARRAGARVPRSGRHAGVVARRIRRGAVVGRRGIPPAGDVLPGRGVGRQLGCTIAFGWASGDLDARADAVGRPGPRRGGRHRELRSRWRRADREADRRHPWHGFHRRRQRLRRRLGQGVQGLLRPDVGPVQGPDPAGRRQPRLGPRRTRRATATTSGPPR